MADYIAPADKTAGDYAVEIEDAINVANNGQAAQPIIDEMCTTYPPKDEEAPEPPAPVDQGMEVYAQKLDAAAKANNVEAMRALCAEMKAVAPPTEPVEPPPVDPNAPPPVDPNAPVNQPA